MTEPTRITIITSLCFFALFVFTSLTLIISQFSQSFSHLFLIFIREKELFDMLSVTLFFIGFVLSSSFIVISTWRDSSDAMQRIIMLTLSIIFIYVVILQVAYEPKAQDIMDMFAIEGSIYHRNFFELVADYMPKILLIVCVYVLFVYAPLLSIIFRIQPNMNNGVGKILSDMRPSINVIIFMLFALSLQPYYYRDNIYAYLDILAFFGAFGLFIYVIKTNRALFSFYEYMNFALLCVSVVICLICTHTLSISDNHFNARYTFLVFAIVCWCVEWMYNNIKLED